MRLFIVQFYQWPSLLRGWKSYDLPTFSTLPLPLVIYDQSLEHSIRRFPFQLFVRPWFMRQFIKDLRRVVLHDVNTFTNVFKRYRLQQTTGTSQRYLRHKLLCTYFRPRGICCIRFIMFDWDFRVVERRDIKF